MIDNDREIDGRTIQETVFMAEPLETLTIEQRGEDYALVRVTPDQKRTEIILTAFNVAFLARLFPQHYRKMLAAKAKALPMAGVGMSLPAPILHVRLSVDLHKSAIRLAIVDKFDGDFDFSCGPAFARRLAEQLLARAAEIENASKTALKQ